MGSNNLASSPGVSRCCHPVILGHHLLQVALGGSGLAARFRDDPMRLLLAELGRERKRYRLGHDASLRRGEVNAHALTIDVESLRNVDDGSERRRR